MMVIMMMWMATVVTPRILQVHWSHPAYRSTGMQAGRQAGVDLVKNLFEVSRPVGPLESVSGLLLDTVR